MTDNTKKVYIIVHVDAKDGVQAWFPDFPGLIVPGDRVSDTLFYGSYALQAHVDKLREKGLPVPEPTSPDVWAIYEQHPEALIGFVALDEARPK